jgi:hypothetical protein
VLKEITFMGGYRQSSMAANLYQLGHDENRGAIRVNYAVRWANLLVTGAASV